MTRYVVRVSPVAEADVARIMSWLAGYSKQGAANWYASFCLAIQSIETHPTAYAVAAEAEVLGREFRERLFRTPRGRHYRLLYTIEGDEIRVFHVRGPGQPLLNNDDLNELK